MVVHFGRNGVLVCRGVLVPEPPPITDDLRAVTCGSCLRWIEARTRSGESIDRALASRVDRAIDGRPEDQRRRPRRRA